MLLSEFSNTHWVTEKRTLRQDNAGCYHSVTMLSACRLMGTATGIHVKFSVTLMEAKALATRKPLPSRVLDCTEDSELLFHVLLQN